MRLAFPWRPAVLLGGLLAAGVAVRLLPGGGPAGWLNDVGGLPPALAGGAFVLLGAGLCALGVPRQVVGYAGGYLFGLWGGVGLALAAQVVGCAANFAWARALGRAWARQRLAGRLARLDARLSANPFVTTLMLRLLPVGNNLLLNLAAGVSGIAAAPFFAASALGYIPQTAVFALVGAGVRIGRGAEVTLGVALFVASAALGGLLLRRLRRAPAAPAAGDLSADSARGATPPGG
jgi:uncharacterized membrane protein YdjX (TVP38/TMEM64 family)